MRGSVALQRLRYPITKLPLTGAAVLDVVDAHPEFALQVKQRFIPRVGNRLHVPRQPAKQIVEAQLLVAVGEQLGTQCIGGRHG
jgi:hypothetical protein